MVFSECRDDTIRNSAHQTNRIADHLLTFNSGRGFSKQLDDRLTRYYPLVLKLFPDSATRPRQREVLIEFLRKGEVDQAVRAFKKLYLEVVHQITDRLETGGGY